LRKELSIADATSGGNDGTPQPIPAEAKLGIESPDGRFNVSIRCSQGINQSTGIAINPCIPRESCISF
jgi:hypothetical protein